MARATLFILGLWLAVFVSSILVNDVSDRPNKGNNNAVDIISAVPTYLILRYGEYYSGRSGSLARCLAAASYGGGSWPQSSNSARVGETHQFVTRLP